MTKLKLEGIYKKISNLSVERGLSGIVDFDGNYFEGPINDSDLPTSKRYIVGKFNNESNTINFLKGNINYKKSDLVHTLSKNEESYIQVPDSIEGFYEGIWTRVPRKFDFSKNSVFFNQNFDAKGFREVRYIELEISKV